MILAIDVGNTNIVSGVFRSEEGNYETVATFRVGTNKSTTTDELGILFKEMLYHNGIDASLLKTGIYSSVVPPVNHSINKMLFKYFKLEPIMVTYENFVGNMPIRYDDPYALGTDRLVNAYAASRLYGEPLIIIDFGTATTYCAVSKTKEYLGGLILPGISISLDALVDRTSTLPKVELDYPKKAIETETVRGMQAGIYYQTIGGVEWIVRNMKKEMNEKDEVKVVATGGLSNYIASGTNFIDIVDHSLMLKGLKIVYDDTVANNR